MILPNKHLGMKRLAVVSTAALLAACGGGDDAPATAAPAPYQPGSVMTLEVATEGQSTSTQRWLIHGVTTQGELIPMWRPSWSAA